MKQKCIDGKAFIKMDKERHEEIFGKKCEDCDKIQCECEEQENEERTENKSN